MPRNIVGKICGLVALSNLGLLACAHGSQQAAASESSAEAKQLVRRYFDEVVNQKKLDVADQIFADTHKQAPFVEPGPKGVKQFLEVLFTAFPDFQGKIEDMVAEGDRVAIRATFTGTHQGPFAWFNLPATGKSVSLEEYMFLTVKDGKIVSRTYLPDVYGLLSQLGAIPQPAK